ncbi:hypothetical protein [Microbacterium sp. NPDC055455]
MPKQIVTALGLIVSLGVIALGVFLVALPLYFQAIGVDAQTSTVAATNAQYQAQVSQLTEQQQNLDEINASVAELRSQIPDEAQLDDVFEVVARAVETTGAVMSSVTAGEQVAFAARTLPPELGTSAAAEPAPQPTPAATPPPADESANPAPAPAAVAPAGRQQVDFVITVTAADMAQATAFVDALRAGPRLLIPNAVMATQNDDGTVDVQVTALTFNDEG